VSHATKSLGSAARSFNLDSNENLTFNKLTLQYDGLNSVTFNPTTASFTAVTGMNPELVSAPTFYGDALPHHKHDIVIDVTINGEEKPKDVSANKIIYSTVDGEPFDFASNIAKMKQIFTGIPFLEFVGQDRIDSSMWVATFDSSIKIVGAKADTLEMGLSIMKVVDIEGGSGVTITNNVEITGIILPEGVEEVHGYGFSGCDVLEYIQFPDSLLCFVENDISPISYCDAIESLYIPKNVNRISGTIYNSVTPGCQYVSVDPDNTSYDSREDCNAIIDSSLNRLIFGTGNSFIPDDVSSIGIYAFANMPLTSIDIPASVTEIIDGAFAGCTQVTSITSRNMTPPTLGYDVFNAVPIDTSIYVPLLSVNRYKSANGWSERALYITAIK